MTGGHHRRCSLLALGSGELRRRAEACSRVFLAAKGGERLGDAEARAAEFLALADEAEQAERLWIDRVARKIRG